MNNYIIKTILAALLLLCSARLSAQTSFNEKIVSTSGVTSSKELICDYGNYSVAYTYSITTAEVAHFFTIQNLTTGVTKKFTMHQDYIQNHVYLHPTTYTINDISNSDMGICYFCGCKTEEDETPPSPPGPPVINRNSTSGSTGFIGLFSISDVFNGNGEFFLLEFDDVSNLTRIEAEGSYVQIYAVGTVRQTSSSGTVSSRSCLLGLIPPESFNINTIWHYDLAIPTDDSEFFTDVADCGVGVVVSSRFQDNPSYIGLYHFKNGISTSNIYGDGYCNKYDLASAISSFSSSHISRTHSDPIMFTHGAYKASVILPCSYPSGQDGIAAFRISVPTSGNVSLHNGIVVHTPAYVNLLDGISTYHNSTEKYALLVENPVSGQDILYLVPWSIASSTAVSPFACNHSAKRWQQLTTYSIDSRMYLHLIGHNSFNRLITQHYISNIPYTPAAGSSCISFGSLTTAYHLSTPNKTTLGRVGIIKENFEVPPQKTTVTVTTLQNTVTCNN